MGMQANVSCFYLDQNFRVIEAVTVDEEQRDGSITIKFAPSFAPKVVRVMHVFRTKVAADRAAINAAQNSPSGRGGQTHR